MRAKKKMAEARTVRVGNFLTRGLSERIVSLCASSRGGWQQKVAGSGRAEKITRKKGRALSGKGEGMELRRTQ